MFALMYLCLCIESFFWIAERVNTLAKSGGIPLRTALFAKLTLSPVSVQFSVKIVFFIPIKTGVYVSIWMTVPCSMFHVYGSYWLTRLWKQMAHHELLKSFKNCKELKAASLKRSLSKSVFLLRVSVLIVIFFSFINWRKCLSTIIVGPLQRTEALAHCVWRDSR